MRPRLPFDKALGPRVCEIPDFNVPGDDGIGRTKALSLHGKTA